MVFLFLALILIVNAPDNTNSWYKLTHWPHRFCAEGVAKKALVNWNVYTASMNHKVLKTSALIEMEPSRLSMTGYFTFAGDICARVIPVMERVQKSTVSASLVWSRTLKVGVVVFFFYHCARGRIRFAKFWTFHQIFIGVRWILQTLLLMSWKLGILCIKKDNEISKSVWVQLCTPLKIMVFLNSDLTTTFDYASQ